jgi:hypothetical protein
MQLDRTSIVIRERGFLEILDLSLRVAARYAVPLFWCWLAAAVPLMLINYLLINWMVADLDAVGMIVRYVNTLILLTLLQAPLVSIFMTTYLGRAVFLGSSTRQSLIADVRRSITPLVWCVMILRAAALSWLLVFLAQRGPRPAAMDVILLLMAMVVVAVRGMRPYLMEIILLERNPLRACREGEISVAHRSRALHGPNTGDLLGRWFAAACVSIALCTTIVLTAWFISGMVFLQWNWGYWMIHAVVPVALWAVAGFMAVVRFLSYMDLRIRNEGWEVELLLRAAADQLPEKAA